MAVRESVLAYCYVLCREKYGEEAFETLEMLKELPERDL